MIKCFSQTGQPSVHIFMIVLLLLYYCFIIVCFCETTFISFLINMGLILDLVPLYVAAAVFVKHREGLLDGLLSLLWGLELLHVVQKPAVVEVPWAQSQRWHQAVKSSSWLTCDHLLFHQTGHCMTTSKTHTDTVIHPVFSAPVACVRCPALWVKHPWPQLPSSPVAESRPPCSPGVSWTRGK